MQRCACITGKQNEVAIMEMSESINELSGALSKAQARIIGALKDAANPFFKSKYADLSSVWDAVREPLTANGLAVIQTTSAPPDGSSVIVTTMLAHSSGQWVRDSLVLQPTKRDPQGIGSAITYGRRYALAAITGCPQIDDDGEAAVGRKGSVSDMVQPAEIDFVKRDKLFNRVMEILKNDDDLTEDGIAAALLKADETLQKDQEMMSAVFNVMPAKARSAYKTYVAQAKAAQDKVLANGRAA
jgi:hypothetical protein